MARSYPIRPTKRASSDYGRFLHSQDRDAIELLKIGESGAFEHRYEHTKDGESESARSSCDKEASPTGFETCDGILVPVRFRHTA